MQDPISFSRPMASPLRLLVLPLVVLFSLTPSLTSAIELSIPTNLEPPFTRPTSSSSLDSPAKIVFPEILHQIWISEAELPPNWRNAHLTWAELHPTWQQMLWNSSLCRELIAANYAWFLPQWDEYDLKIQRADVCRYFVLYHYGGVYADLDIRPLRSIAPILAEAAEQRKQVLLLEKDSEITGSRIGGICIGLMASIARSQFWEEVFRMLLYRRSRWYYRVSNHLRVIFGTGPQVVIPVYWTYRAQMGVFPAQKFYACHSCVALPCQREGGWVRFESGGLLWNKADSHIINFFDCRVLRPILVHLGGILPILIPILLILGTFFWPRRSAFYVTGHGRVDHSAAAAAASYVGCSIPVKCGKIMWRTVRILGGRRLSIRRRVLLGLITGVLVFNIIHSIRSASVV